MNQTAQCHCGRRPAPCKRLSDLLLEEACLLDDDRLATVHTLADYRTFLADGYLDQEEAVHLHRHLRLDVELTEMAAGLSRSCNLAYAGVEALVDRQRATRKSESRSKATLTHTPAA